MHILLFQSKSLWVSGRELKRIIQRKNELGSLPRNFPNRRAMSNNDESINTDLWDDTCLEVDSAICKKIKYVFSLKGRIIVLLGAE